MPDKDYSVLDRGIMAVTINARGTSVPFFKIGKSGSTIYAGSANPADSYTILTGDIWVNTSTGAFNVRVSDSWQSAAIGNFLPLTGGTLTGTLTISNTSPVLAFDDTDAGTDNRRWRTRASGVNYIIDTANDAFDTFQTAYQIIRTNNSTTVAEHRWSTDNTERVRIDLTGNVGLGTTSITQRLTISGNIQQDNSNYLQGKLAAGTATRLFGLNSSNLLYIGSIDAAHSDTLFVRNGSEQMRINSSGNVGIGKAAPLAKLHIENASATTTLMVGATDARFGFLQWVESSSIFRLATDGAFPVVFSTNTTERARVTSTGDFGIGTNNPQARLHVSVSGTGNGSGDVISETVGANGNAGYRFRTAGTDRWSITVAGTDGTNYLRIRDENSSAERVRIDSSGNVLIGTTSVTDSAKLTVNGTVSVATPTLSSHATTKAYVDAAVGSGSTGLSMVVVTNATQTASSGSLYVMTNTSEQGFLTLPASAALGDTVAVSNFTNRTDLVVVKNGHKIMGIDENMTIDQLKVTVTFRYVNTSIGWIIV